MQLIPRYLVNNRTTIVANEAGFVTEYRPVYQKHIQVYKGIDNVLEFKVLNPDQKPIVLSSYTPKFQAFDENKKLIIEQDGVQVTSDGSTPIKGVFKITITENAILNIKDQFLSYSIYLVDANDVPVITYTDTHFGMNGVINISSAAFPGPVAAHSVAAFKEVGEVWVTGPINAEPAINGNEALHTAAIYTTAYAGIVTVQATLDNQTSEQTAWDDVVSKTFDGTETTPVSINVNGVYSYLRFISNVDPAEKITKILVRN
jgi:hypothetical protein|tara:strand:- start:276 stop:1055 length:780 start_codon:yes stop_codon:yes gene_type:complete